MFYLQQPMSPNGKRAFFAMVLIALISMLWPLLTPVPSAFTQKDDGLDGIFKSPEDALFAFSTFCLTRAANFDQKIADLEEIGAKRVDVKGDGIQKTMLTSPVIKGGVTYVTEGNRSACWVFVLQDFTSVSQAAETWFFGDKKSAHFPMLADPRLNTISSEGELSWSLETEEGDTAQVISLADRTPDQQVPLTLITLNEFDFAMK